MVAFAAECMADRVRKPVDDHARSGGFLKAIEAPRKPAQQCARGQDLAIVAVAQIVFFQRLRLQQVDQTVGNAEGQHD